ncbi:hypothetical protein SBP02_13170 [Pseudomonas benzenivorans]|uniref:Uncharacterized protein n=1 Tax=Pseudomonas benzenivorans TaxID=556533 RepID=A0ABZ0PS57_9PSED|nr:hypothetical protein [Pseudomonas benzenivorans]WPC03730.1 hypothetical protein SBP02_13170 [Pseudomonas benzenivorans]
MRMLVLALSWLVASWATALAAQSYPLSTPQQRPAGSPGTATPQPFSQPQPRSLSGTAPHNLPLLIDGTGNRGGPLNPQPAPPPPRDAELPLLEQQLRRNSQRLGD